MNIQHARLARQPIFDRGINFTHAPILNPPRIERNQNLELEALEQNTLHAPVQKLLPFKVQLELEKVLASKWVVTNLSAQIQKAGAELAEIAALIAKDPALSVKLMRPANPTVFSAGCEITSLQDGLSLHTMTRAKREFEQTDVDSICWPGQMRTVVGNA